LDTVEKGQIPKDAITPYHARQINSLGEAALSQKLTAVWGALRDAGENKTAAIAAYKGTLPPSVLAQADLSAGRAVFAQSCAACHTLYGEGGKLGPDLTGAGRDNLDYLLESIMDPSALVSADYRMTLLHTKDGRVLSGMVRSKTEHTVTLQTMTETLTLERSDVVRTEELPHSIMPEGLLENLPPDKARDLLAYLMHKSQVPLPPTR
jgi:putative heme-binding domain-containing protein